MNWRFQALRRLRGGEPANLSMSIGCSFYGFILIGVSDAVLGVVLPSVIAQYGLNKATVGVLFPATSLGFLISAFTSGLLFERLGARAALILGVSVFALGALCFATTAPFVILPFALLCIGSGEAILDTGFNAYIARTPRSSVLLNYLHAFYGIGALLGPLLAGAILALSWRWNTVYGVLVGGSLVALLGIAAAFPHKANDDKGPGRHQEPTVDHAAGNTLVMALNLPVVRLCAVFLLFYVGAEFGLGVWSYSLLTERLRATPLFASWIVSGYWMGLTLGRLILGRVVARFGARSMIYACLLGVACGVIVFWAAPNVAFAASGLCLIGFSLGPIYPTTISVIGSLLPVRLQHSAIGFVTSAGSLGAALVPWVVGTLAQRVGLGVLPPVALLLTAMMFVLWWAVSLH